MERMDGYCGQQPNRASMTDPKDVAVGPMVQKTSDSGAAGMEDTAMIQKVSAGTRTGGKG